MKIKSILLVLSFVLVSCSVWAQKTFEVPKNVKLEKASDYEKYENDVIEAAKWLVETDLNKEKDKRQEVNTFVLAWFQVALM